MTLLSSRFLYFSDGPSIEMQEKVGAGVFCSHKLAGTRQEEKPWTLYRRANNGKESAPLGRIPSESVPNK